MHKKAILKEWGWSSHRNFISQGKPPNSNFKVPFQCITFPSLQR